MIQEVFNPWITELCNLNIQSLEVVSRYRDTKLQVIENFYYLLNLNPYIYQCFKIECIFYCEELIIRGYTGANKNTECPLQSTSVL